MLNCCRSNTSGYVPLHKMCSTSHKMTWPISLSLRGHLETKYKTGTPMVKACMRFEAMRQAHATVLLHPLCPAATPGEEKHVFLPSSFQKLLTLLQKLVLLAPKLLGSLVKRQISWPPPQDSDLGVWGGAQKSTVIGRAHSDLDTNYSQTSWHTGIESI